MKVKSYFLLITSLISEISFSQTKPNDTLKCQTLFEDLVVSKVTNAYENRPTQPIVSTPRGPSVCGTPETGETREAERKRCRNGQMILEKYPFVIDEIKKKATEYPNYKKADIFWLEKDKTQGDKNINAYREKELKKWMTHGNHSYFSAIIISDKTDGKHEKITLMIKFPGQVITKHYKL